uniref:F-box domain-containing protein n=1 Tax=Panagrellus redivivus TaxID=6233 RepID=A0A7E4UM39_PANRE
MAWSDLQDGFKSRLVELAQMVELPKLTETCPDIRTRCLHRPKVYNCVFITDKGLLLKAALDEMKTDNFIEKFLNYASFYKCTRYIYDGPVTFDQKWDSAIYGDALNLTKPIYVRDTLILHCRNIEVYEAVIPFISGSYSRLVVYGKITWNQVKKLLHGNVKQIRIEGEVTVDQSQYDDVVEFIQGFCRGFMYKLIFIPHEMLQTVIGLETARSL